MVTKCVYFILPRFVYARLHNQCRREEILGHFGEEPTEANRSSPCCDVCDDPRETSDGSSEIKAVLRAISELPQSREKKVSYPHQMFGCICNLSNYYQQCYTYVMHIYLLVHRFLSAFVGQQTKLLPSCTTPQ